MTSDRVVAVVMAAGFSTRFGREDKRKATLPGGSTLLRASVVRAREVFPVCRVVLQNDDDPRDFGLPVDTRVIHARGAAGGLGCSLADAFREISTDPSLATIEAAAVFLGDMPSIQRSTLNILLQSAKRSQIVRPCCEGRAGHPVVFGRQFWPELTKLQGDAGAQAVIRRNESCYCKVAVKDSGISVDIDTPIDLLRVH